MTIHDPILPLLYRTVKRSKFFQELNSPSECVVCGRATDSYAACYLSMAPLKIPLCRSHNDMESLLPVMQDYLRFYHTLPEFKI